MTPEDIDVMARTIFGEARGEPLEGKIAVAWVIKNRADNPSWWGDSIFSVCKKPFQFSAWNQGDPNRPKMICVTPQDEAFSECLMVTAGVLTRNYPDITGSANHYCTKNLNPPWSKGKEPVAFVGNHKFYRL